MSNSNSVPLITIDILLMCLLTKCNGLGANEVEEQLKVFDWSNKQQDEGWYSKDVSERKL